LAEEGKRVPIVIGIDNGGAERINELTPWENDEYGGGDGDLYTDFIIETLKPYVDENYRTQAGRESTGIMGSSLGGLISFYGAHKYQAVFSKAGIFSPSYWFSDSVWLFTNEIGKQQNMKFYQMAGGQESSTMIPNMQAMNDSLSNLGFASRELFIKEVPGGQHNEALWRSQFSEAYLWLFSEYATDVIGINPVVNLNVRPNPVQDILYIGDYKWEKQDSIEIIDMKGVSVMQLSSPTSNAIDVSRLSTGSYVIIIQTEGAIYQTKFLKK
jgi:predicted esterase